MSRVTFFATDSSYSHLDREEYPRTEIYAQKADGPVRLPISRNTFSGNFLGFTIMKPEGESDYELLFNKEWVKSTVDSLKAISENVPYFVGSSRAIVANNIGKKLVLIECSNVASPNSTC